MLDTTYGYEAGLKAESVARRKRLNVGRVPAPIKENPAPSQNSDGHLRLIAEPEGSGAPMKEIVSAQDYVPLYRNRPLAYETFKTNRVRTIARAACRHFHVDMRDLMSAQRTLDVVIPRQIVMYLSRLMTPHSTPWIGHNMGDRDHTTVINGVRKITARLLTDPQLAADVEAVKALAIAADPGLGQ